MSTESIDPATEQLGHRRELSKTVLTWLFLGAAALRLLVLFDFEAHQPFAERPVIDEAAYEDWALEIAGGDWIGDEVFFQEPLYPYVMGAWYAVFGADRTLWRGLQALLGALVAVQVARLGSRLFGARAGVVGGWAWALHGPGLLFPALLLKPNLFLPLFVLGVGWMVAEARAPAGPAWRRWALGVALGLGALLRGNALILIPAAVALPLVCERWIHGRSLRAGLRAAGLVALGVACVLFPVALRNQAVGGVLALTTSGAGTNLYGGNNEHNLLGRATEFPWVRGIPEYEAGDWLREAERRSGRTMDLGDSSGFWMAELGRSLSAEPGLHAQILANKAVLTLGGYEVPDNHGYDWDRSWLSSLRYWPIDLYLIGPLGIAGLLMAVVSGRGGRGGRMLALALVAYTLTIVLTVTSMRARLPLVPLLAPFAGFAAVQLFEQRREVGRLLTRWGPALAIGCAVVWGTRLCFDLAPLDEEKRDYNAAVYWADSGELDLALPILEELSEKHPGTPQVELRLARVHALQAFELRESGDTQASQARLAEALKRVRWVVDYLDVPPKERARGQFLAGIIQLESGKPAVAVRFFESALEFDESDPIVLYQLVQALLGVGSPSDVERARSVLVGLVAQDPADPRYRGDLERVEAYLAEARAE